MAGARGSSLVFLITSLLLFLITAFNPASLGAVRSGVTDISAPVIAAVHAPIQGAADYVRAITGIAQLQEENMRLQQENMRLREWRQTALLLQSENKAFRDLLNVKTPMAKSYVTAPVIADSGNAYVRSLLVMGGMRDGVKNGQAAMAAEGLIGRVIEAGNTASRILLLSDINSRIPVLIEGDNWRAVLAGRNEEPAKLLHIPPEAKLEAGQRVITSGHGGLFPQGLPVGEIGRGEDGAFIVVPYADIERVQFVKIVDKVLDPNLRKGQI
jgi:rod shape-determining protein MreC